MVSRTTLASRFKRKGNCKAGKERYVTDFFKFHVLGHQSMANVQLSWLGPVPVPSCNNILRIVHINLTSSVIPSTPFKKLDTFVSTAHLFTHFRPLSFFLSLFSLLLS